jgi:branched-chain amino acid transport system permease protein
MTLDLLLSGQLLLAALILGALYALAALGLNLIYGTMRLLNVAHGDIAMVGAYTAFWGFTLFGLTPLLSLLAAAALAALLGAALYRGLFRNLLARTRRLDRLEANSLLLFFGVSVVMQNVAAYAFGATPRAYQYFDTIFSLGGISAAGNRLLAFAVALALVAGILWFLHRHILGLAIKALIQQREAAAVVGINVDRVQLLSFCLGFALAAIAGSLASMTEQISPFIGFPITIAAFVVIILGGLGNLAGGAIAGFVLAAIEIYGVALTSSNFRSILLYGVFVLILVIRPQGLFGGLRIAR